MVWQKINNACYNTSLLYISVSVRVLHTPNAGRNLPIQCFLHVFLRFWCKKKIWLKKTYFCLIIIIIDYDIRWSRRYRRIIHLPLSHTHTHEEKILREICSENVPMLLSEKCLRNVFARQCFALKKFVVPKKY